MLKTIVMCIPNTLLSGGLSKYLQEETGNRIYTEDDTEKLADTCAVVEAEVLLAEARNYAPYRVDDWLKIWQNVKMRQPVCKFALVVDETTFPDTARCVRQARSDGMIDAFFFESVSGEYVTAVIDSL